MNKINSFIFHFAKLLFYVSVVITIASIVPLFINFSLFVSVLLIGIILIIFSFLSMIIVFQIEKFEKDKRVIKEFFEKIESGEFRVR